jgi:hypothetical protein
MSSDRASLIRHAVILLVLVTIIGFTIVRFGPW